MKFLRFTNGKNNKNKNKNNGNNKGNDNKDGPKEKRIILRPDELEVGDRVLLLVEAELFHVNEEKKRPHIKGGNNTPIYQFDVRVNDGLLGGAEGFGYLSGNDTVHVIARTSTPTWNQWFKWKMREWFGKKPKTASI